MTTTSKTLSLAQALIREPSVTPEDCECQSIMIKRLKQMGFRITDLPFGEVKNFWAELGETGPLFCFAGHTDVVPTGPESEWSHPPFDAVIHNGLLHGRGAADMKGSLAAMITACEDFLAEHPAPQGRIGFLITSDEEGPATNGTVKVVEWLQQQNKSIDWCLVGEPSSTDRLGDVVKNGRRGSINGELTVHGVQGHIAYPHLAENPIHSALPALDDLVKEEWDEGNAFFPATSFQVSNINAGTGATNVIPGSCEVVFNFRFSSELTEDEIRQRTHQILDRHNLNYTLKWKLSGHPFLTQPGKLVDAISSAIESTTGFTPKLSTGGGTSDGRFIAPMGTQVVELGPINATIHQIDERVSIEDLENLNKIYQKILQNLLA